MASGTTVSLNLHTNESAELILPNGDIVTGFNAIKISTDESIEISKNGRYHQLGEKINEIQNEDFNYYFIDINNDVTTYRPKK